MKQDKSKKSSRFRNSRFYPLWKKWRLRLEIVLFLLVIIVVFCWDKIFITIHSGELGVHFRRFSGTVLDKPPLAEGLHIIFPLDIVEIYDVRQQEYNHTFNVLANDGLHVEVDVSIRYHPSREKTDLNYLHVHLGPDYLDRVIIPEVESALRFVIGKYDPEELYHAEYGMLDAALNESLLQLKENYIVLDDLLIKQVILPEFVQKAIEEKLTEFHNAEKYKYLLKQAEEEAKRKVILATGIRDFQDIVSEGISPELLRWRGIEATLELAKSNNAKIVIIGSAEDGLPLILNTGDMANPVPSVTSAFEFEHNASSLIPGASGTVPAEGVSSALNLGEGLQGLDAANLLRDNQKQ